VSNVASGYELSIRRHRTKTKKVSNTKTAITNGQFIATSNIGHTRHRTKTRKVSNTDSIKNGDGEPMCTQGNAVPASFKTSAMLLIHIVRSGKYNVGDRGKKNISIKENHKRKIK
jgi:hypothetical protein